VPWRRIKYRAVTRRRQALLGGIVDASKRGVGGTGATVAAEWAYAHDPTHAPGFKPSADAP
jgi:hypothetical protein